MFGDSKESRGHVQPIKFKTIADDNGFRETESARNKEELGEPLPAISKTSWQLEDGNHTNALRHRRTSRCSNEQQQHSYPAVTLENVCFSVDRSQQQANFAKEVLFRLSNCLNPLLNETGEPSRRVEILKSVNLRVPTGSIFGLLGPSSCGKTTLLRCLVGLLEPSSGSIRLFSDNAPPSAGHQASGNQNDDNHHHHHHDHHYQWHAFPPASSSPSACNSSRASCKVPGANVGYMPQDLGLYEDFTIEQLLTMFGRYMRMEAKLIKTRVAFMANFLELPHVGRQIQTLSGGQKRRVSFAIACLHMPPLIILDEPTVGVDPLLRQSIWRYLRRLASEENRTIIITTHYIEEAAQADQVALMRAGEILIQDTPARIMASHKSRTLEEAFLKICNNVHGDEDDEQDNASSKKPPPPPTLMLKQLNASSLSVKGGQQQQQATVISELQLRAQAKLALYDKLPACCATPLALCPPDECNGDTNLSMIPNVAHLQQQAPLFSHQLVNNLPPSQVVGGKTRKLPLLKRSKFTLNDHEMQSPSQVQDQYRECCVKSREPLGKRLNKTLILFWALLYKNYRRNVNSIPLLAFQFMLPMIQMISFSLCVGGRPTNVGLGIVNHDQPVLDFNGPLSLAATDGLLSGNMSAFATNFTGSEEFEDERLSLRYLSFIDSKMLTTKPYEDLQSALADVRRAKLWAVLEIGENFSSAIAQRFDLDNFYQLERATIAQSVIKLYPDRSNKILDMICHRSLVDSYRKFLSTEFDHFKRLPLEMARPIFDIAPNAISNSIDGYTESIAPGLLASLTYIMAAGLTTFIMVVERSAGILERTYTSGINPAAYLLAHALFRSLVMMLQIGAVLILTFYVLQQPLVGSLWLAYAQLMVLNMTGIAYGLLISSIVADQNGAALTIVSSLVVKITMSGILWPFEAIPRWLRAICYIQPLTMPVQALKAITLKGATLGDRSVNLGFLVSLFWLLVFLVIATKRFKFYQH